MDWVDTKYKLNKIICDHIFIISKKLVIGISKLISYKLDFLGYKLCPFALL